MGEVLWDVFPDAQRLGGAPANVAFHAARLGAEASLHSRVGRDELGELAISELRRAGVDTSSVDVDPELPTGTVLVALQEGEPSYTIVAPAAWDRITATPRFLAEGQTAVRPPHALVFGSLAARRTDQAERMLGWLSQVRSKGSTRLVLDLNLRRPHLSVGFIKDALGLVQLLKLNEEELTWLASAGVHLAPAFVRGTERPAVNALFERFEVELLVLTRGERGATLFTRTETFDAPGIPVVLGDAVGAGDAFLAALLVALIHGEALPACLDQANRRAAEVAAVRGAMSVS